MNVAGDLMDRPLRSPIDVAVRAFAISRKQRFDLELRNVPESVEVVRAPRARRRSRAVRLLRCPLGSSTTPTDLAERRSTRPSRPSAARRQLRRPWWRRDAEVV